jgi:hypothetical protein
MRGTLGATLRMNWTAASRVSKSSVARRAGFLFGANQTEKCGEERPGGLVIAGQLFGFLRQSISARKKTQPAATGGEHPEPAARPAIRENGKLPVTQAAGRC